jgi:hypothetical protein
MERRRIEVFIKFRSENMKGRDKLGDIGADGKTTLKLVSGSRS